MAALSLHPARHWQTCGTKAFEIGYYSNKFIENFRCARLNDVCATAKEDVDAPIGYWTCVMPTEKWVSSSEVAQWMIAELERRGHLERDLTVRNIEQIFGHQFISENTTGTPVIKESVMKAFWRLAEHCAVWDYKNREWVRLHSEDCR